MCAIAGEVNVKDGVGFAPYHPDMISCMKRRGPDDDGMYSDSCATLLHARLAVIDPENGRQPMTAAKDEITYTIVYNGELYNTDEVRERLKSEGEQFMGHSDTEVVLKAYINHGEKCVEEFNGIFAFAVWNDEEKTLFIARDRMGVKPFFYAVRGNSFIFASELKGLLIHPDIEPVIGRTGLSELLFIGPGRTPGCGVFEGVEELKPGHCGHFTGRGLHTRQYWTYSDRVHPDSLQDTIARAKWLVTDAVTRQLVSDVPIGTFLSGGLDSSIISAIAKKHMAERGERLKTFSVAYKDNEKYFTRSRFQPNSDDEYIDIMVKFLDSDHETFLIDTDQLVSALYSAADARDLPGMADVDASLLLFCDEIRQHVTVALSGECADEIFGGYPWYRDEKIRSAYGFPWAQSTRYRASFLNKELRDIIDGQEYVNARYEETLAQVSKLPHLAETESRMREMVHLNTYWFMQTLLDRKDRMSMYNGLEVRVPFCDYRIAEYLYGVPWEMKDLEGREKGLLRAAMQGVLPDEVLWRKKSPYPKTHNPAYRDAVARELQNILSGANEPLFTLLDRDAVKSLLTTDRSEPWYGQLMTTPQTMAYLIQLNYWLKKFNVRFRF